MGISTAELQQAQYAVTRADDITIHDIVKQETAIHGYGGAAVTRIVNRIIEIPALARELIGRAVWREVQLARISVRTQAKVEHGKPMPKPCARDAKAIDSIGAVMRTAFLESWKLEGNRTLADATGIELAIKAKDERNKGYGHIKVAMFYELLRKSVPDKATVRSKVTDADAAAMWREINNSKIDV